jgi:hypothetical protein
VALVRKRTAACRRSLRQLLQIEYVMWSAQRIPAAVNFDFLDPASTVSSIPKFLKWSLTMQGLRLIIRLYAVLTYSIVKLNNCHFTFPCRSRQTESSFQSELCRTHTRYVFNATSSASQQELQTPSQ